MKYGVDVAATRADDLDKVMLAHVANHPGERVLDIGCGSGGQAKRLAAAGAEVFAIDIQDYMSHFTDYPSITFQQQDARNISHFTAGQTFSVICLQRTLHYLEYHEAIKLLQYLRQVCVVALYVSVTGLESDIGRQYPCHDQVLEQRFCTLPVAAADTFSITEPVCLYTQEEFKTLLETSGWGIEKLWTSAFGNHKVVAVPLREVVV